MRAASHGLLALSVGSTLLVIGCASSQPPSSPELSEAEMQELVLRSYPYVAMFNVNNKFALDPDNPLSSGGYNRVKANTDLADHTVQAIARPNNDTLYVVAMVDVTAEPVVLEIPAFDSKYVSLMVTAYDHYVNIPLSTSQGDFDRPTTMLFYSQRTPGYDGEPVDGAERDRLLQYDQATACLVGAGDRVRVWADTPAARAGRGYRDSTRHVVRAPVIELLPAKNRRR